MQQSMSISVGKVAGHAHMVEVEYRQGLDNVDPSRTELNRVLRDVPLEQLYRETFGAAVDEYNRKQVEKGHPERQIGDYLEKLRSGKQEKPSYEMVVQIGSRDTNPASDEACRFGSGLVYEDFLEEFERRFPQLRVYQAAVHVDEATPHLHVAYVPVSEGNRRGLGTKNSLRGALRQMGFSDVRELNAAMFEVLEEVCARRGIERLDMGCNRAHLSVRDFKAMQAELEAEEAYPYRNDPRLVQLVVAQQEQIEQLSETCEELTASVESLVRHDPRPWNLSTLRDLFAEIGEQAARVRGVLEGARALAERARECIEAVPQLWRDRIINPVTDRLRRERDEWVEMMDDRRAEGDSGGGMTLDQLEAECMEPVGFREAPVASRGPRGAGER